MFLAEESRLSPNGVTRFCRRVAFRPTFIDVAQEGNEPVVAELQKVESVQYGVLARSSAVAVAIPG
jgi:hypothetical protein